jgi:M6 family metalloprotease-like protein
MVSGIKRRVTVLALLFVALLSIVASPGFSPIVSAQSHPLVMFAPSRSMPLPTPSPGTISSLAPVSGVLRVLVIAAAFSDINYTTPLSTLKTEFFGGVASYYHEISYGSITLQGDIYGWYKLPYPEAHYGRDCLSIDDADCSGADGSWQVAQDAATLAQKDVDFKNYNYYVFIHSGNGQESSGVKDDVWSVTYLGGVLVQTSTKTISKFEIVPEVEAAGAVPEGVFTHEFGHQLGLPDLYNTYNGKTILGPWSLMDKGLWNGNPPGSSPGHMEAWSKIQLGFISGSMLAIANGGTTNTYTIDPTEVASNKVHAVEIPVESSLTPAHYYLVEVRASIGFDSALPATGVLISYVDSTASVGRVRIMDGHPNVPDLNDATWNVGQTFTDTGHTFSVTVTGQSGNSYQVTVNRGGGPPPPIQNQTYVDLGITSISSQPQVVTVPNTTVTLNVQISNSGTQAVSNVQVEADLDGQYFATNQINVGAGSSTQTSFTWVSKPGSHLFRIVVDPNNAINDTNRANNVATYTVNVGPVLTVDVPANVTSAGNIWVLINGVKYNLTSGQLQTSVPNGTITVQIEPTFNTSQGIRQIFSGWSDGNVSNPRHLIITSNTVLNATYAVEYLLSIDQNGGTTTASAWYKPNAVVQVSASNPSNVIQYASRLVFTDWSGDFTSNSTSLTVNMTKPVSLKADWTKQYYVTILSGSGSPTGSGWYNAGNIASISVQSIVEYPNGTRRLFAGWNSTLLGNSPVGQIYVVAPTTLKAAWKTQYLVTVKSEYGTPTGSGWYDIGSSASISVQPEVDYGNATRRTFASWTGNYSGSKPSTSLRVYAPATLTAKWNTEYLVTFKVEGVSNSTVLTLNLNSTNYDLPANNQYQTWYEKGATINPVVNDTLTDGFMVHKFSGWRNATGGAVGQPWAVSSPGTYVASYSTDMSLPPIPGFPIEATILGILLGSMMLAAIRRKRK